MPDDMANQGVSSPQAGAYWRPMGFLNVYRLIIACVFVGSHFILHERIWWENYNGSLYIESAIGYLIASILAIVFTWLRWPRFNRQLTLQTIADIGFIVVLMYAAGGVKSGLGLLLVVAIAAASLISQGRLALFYAALASIALLLEQSYQMLTWDERYSDYSHAVMLSLSCFATAWLAHSFAKRTHQSEELASQRGVDLENLAQVNALITQEMQDGVLVVDKDFKLRHHNTQAEGLLGIAQHAWDAQTLDECAPELASLMRDWISAEDEIGPSSIKLTTEERELRLRFMPVGSNRQQGAVIFVEDWSQMQIQAQQLKLAALGRLTVSIAHEIRNPLSAISHANQLLQEETLTPSSQRMLQIIGDNVQRMDQMVKDVLELNRRDRTRQATIELEEFLREFHDQFCQVEKIPSSGFQLHLEQTTIHITFDHRHLHQILWNLCRNGWRHSKQDKSSLTLSLHTSANSRIARLEIYDDGAGVIPENRPHLFEPFFTTETTGTGLGLYIARELCEANGANIQYAAMENGSLFVIQLKKHTIK
jgi:two-component system sensor histidine kinase PilS (NtrC family)